jgi:hypothetical protein
MSRNAYDFSIRESLQSDRRFGWTVVAVLFLSAIGVSSYYLWPHKIIGDPTHAFYSDDNGRTIFKDSIYHFPPFEHNGRTAVEAVLAESHGRKFVAYLMRYTPEAKQRLQQKYDDAVANNLQVQRVVLDFMNAAPISRAGTEIKLPGSGHDWVPSSQLSKLDIKAPDGELPDAEVTR